MNEATVSDAMRTESAPIDPLPPVRQAVRALLLATPAYHELDAERRRRVAELMVRICHTAASLIVEEIESDSLARRQSMDVAPPTSLDEREFVQQQAVPDATPRRSQPPLALAQNAGSEFSGVSASRIADTTRNVLNAVSFPRFVNELINGVFKAILESNMQQMQSFIELLNNVAASTEGFADLNMGPDRARSWLVESFPGNFEIEGSEDEDGWGDRTASDEPNEARIQLRAGASMPPADALRTSLGLDANESIPSSPEALVPFVRRQLARQRQEMLGTMVMLGMQRIVIDGGKINAAMRFHIDTRSAAQSDVGSAFDFRHQSSASGSFGIGPWGLSASMTNTIGFVSTQRTQTTEEMNTDLDLSSSVELIFRTDQVPLNRLANATQITQIMANTRNPEAEIASRERTARAERAARSEETRGQTTEQLLTPRASTPTPAAPPAANRTSTPATTPANPASNPSAANRSTSPASNPATPPTANRTNASATTPANPASDPSAASRSTSPASNPATPPASSQPNTTAPARS